MAEADLKKASGITGTINTNVVNEVNIRDLSCDRDHPDICDRANRILGIISTITNPVDISDRCARLLGQLCVSGVAIDPRQIRNLVFATDKVDVSGSSVTTVPGSVVTMDDAFMELRLMADMLKDLPLALEPNTSRVRVNVETGTLTTVTTVTTLSNITNIGGISANSFIYDTMDIIWNTGLRTNGII